MTPLAGDVRDRFIFKMRDDKLPPPNILIVEDERILAENIKQFLGHRVTNVRVAPDGEHALEMIKTFLPDAIVMDYRLPGMNGLDTYSEIVRRNARQIDCVMITAEPEEQLVRSASERGIRSVLAKPFSFAELLRHLEPAVAAASKVEAEDALASGK